MHLLFPCLLGSLSPFQWQWKVNFYQNLLSRLKFFLTTINMREIVCGDFIGRRFLRTYRVLTKNPSLRKSNYTVIPPFPRNMTIFFNFHFALLVVVCFPFALSAGSFFSVQIFFWLGIISNPFIHSFFPFSFFL